jgi:hypothetical protein
MLVNPSVLIRIDSETVHAGFLPSVYMCAAGSAVLRRMLLM